MQIAITLARIMESLLLRRLIRWIKLLSIGKRSEQRIKEVLQATTGKEWHESKGISYHTYGYGKYATWVLHAFCMSFTHSEFPSKTLISIQ